MDLCYCDCLSFTNHWSVHNVRQIEDVGRGYNRSWSIDSNVHVILREVGYFVTFHLAFQRAWRLVDARVKSRQYSPSIYRCCNNLDLPHDFRSGETEINK